LDDSSEECSFINKIWRGIFFPYFCAKSGLGMDSFIVSARKYRPVTFDSVVGQQSITTTLKNAISKQKLAHAYLFFGPRGVGKTTCARIFAKTINCSNITPQMEACDQCESCVAFNQNRSYNIHELDAASNNSVEDIRNLIDQVRIPPQIGRYSIYIIDEVHMLSLSAFNAFLKTLEEPPAHAIFILATTEKHKIIPTILSRCQIFDFSRIDIEDIAQHLASIATKENVTFEPDGLNIIAQKADGAMRDALSIFDQIVSFSGGHITYENVIENLNVLDFEYYFKLTDAFLNCDYAGALNIFNDILNKGFDGHNFINGLSKHLRDLLVSKDPVTIGLLEAGASIREKYRDQSQRCDDGFLLEALEINNRCDINYKSSNHTRLHVELCLLQLSVLNQKKKTGNQPIVTGNNLENSSNVSGRSTEFKSKQVDELPGKVVVPEPVLPSSLVAALEKKKEQESSADTPGSPGAGKKIPSMMGDFPRVQDVLNQTQPKTPSVQPVNTPILEPEKTGAADVVVNTPVTSQKVKEVWLDYARSMEVSEPRLANTMMNHLPEVAGFSTLKIMVNNESQVLLLNESRQALLNNLKANSGFSGQIDIVVSQVPLTDKHIYTAEDKFQYLTKKNQELERFRQTFLLDFE
jgi:DNA polymerase III subunit gamma/tau